MYELTRCRGLEIPLHRTVTSLDEWIAVENIFHACSYFSCQVLGSYLSISNCFFFTGHTCGHVHCTKSLSPGSHYKPHCIPVQINVVRIEPIHFKWTQIPQNCIKDVQAPFLKRTATKTTLWYGASKPNCICDPSGVSLTLYWHPHQIANTMRCRKRAGIAAFPKNADVWIGAKGVSW